MTKLLITTIAIVIIAFLIHDHNERKEIERIKYIEAKNFFIDDELNSLDEKEFLDIADSNICTTDCSGHEAGFEWAKENNIWKAEDCEGQSKSFIEGCEVYAKEVDDIFNNTENREGFEEYISDFLDESDRYDY